MVCFHFCFIFNGQNFGSKGRREMRNKDLKGCLILEFKLRVGIKGTNYSLNNPK